MKEDRKEEMFPGEEPNEPECGENQTDGQSEEPKNWDIPHNEKKTSWKREVWEWLKIIVSAAVIAWALNTFIIANSEVPSGSMENTIMTGDRVIGSRLSYKFEDPQRGDIVIFRFPDNEKIFYVKRIIGMPGDTVDIVDGKVYLNGSSEPLDEPYIREPMIPEAAMHFEVPEDSYFMMGDNRNYSLDARRWQNTYVKREKIIAKVLFRYFPKPGVLK
ncbi:signal peptidase I [Brotaphodocola sp.]|uniref:signal peptidase I n=1 Tax=Brotaphodocola sp. TaxID=3073577 RepID=UPI003D7E5A9A